MVDVLHETSQTSGVRKCVCTFSCVQVCSGICCIHIRLQNDEFCSVECGIIDGSAPYCLSAGGIFSFGILERCFDAGRA